MCFFCCNFAAAIWVNLLCWIFVLVRLTHGTFKTLKTFLTYNNYDLQQRGTGNVPSS